MLTEVKRMQKLAGLLKENEDFEYPTDIKSFNKAMDQLLYVAVKEKLIDMGTKISKIVYSDQYEDSEPEIKTTDFLNFAHDFTRGASSGMEYILDGFIDDDNGGADGSDYNYDLKRAFPYYRDNLLTGWYNFKNNALPEDAEEQGLIPPGYTADDYVLTIAGLDGEAHELTWMHLFQK